MALEAASQVPCVASPPRASRAPTPDIRVSFEFFPPNTVEMDAILWESVNRLAPLAPSFV